MFSKAIVLLLLAASAIAQGPIPEGTYRILNFRSQTPAARVDYAGGPIYVTSYPTNFGPYDPTLWMVKNAADNGYTIENVYLNTIKMLDTFAAVGQPIMNGQPVVTNRDATVFSIESAGNDAFVIKIQYDDLLWNVQPPATSGAVVLQPADGAPTELWFFDPVGA